MKKACTILFVLLASFITLSHDYWFKADLFILTSGDILKLHLLVGDDLEVELERSFQPHKTLSFDLYTDSGRENLLASDIDTLIPVLTRKVNFDGLGLVSMERDFSYIELTPDDFRNYLEHEFIQDDEKIIAELGNREMERERYARSIKALIKAGERNYCTQKLYKKVLGHNLEIILLNNPYELEDGDQIVVQLLRKGEPLAGKKVMALNKTDKFIEHIQVTDREGKVTFTLDNHGMWVIRSLNLYPCQNCEEVDWESYWASYSFQLVRRLQSSDEYLQ